ncbi:PREDICTED: uncharacterized protein LOC109581925 [Amphimedon queenslandica]|uniref:Uncharacterized protein n=1 Tax=Amphimedon queenslandica TaxID=400682 RepID=A0AAN0J5G6_AMPQE|nr:PREDICTED: uncharacterized protein LOC109581925 [Amphimedon queenslandica]|eukprot:XP_019851987.1 PREDICTED: uncharacterized protein LOC109581925 [Amphimedon queenslandica]
MCLSTGSIVISFKHRFSQYSVLKASDDDGDDTPPPIPAYNPNGVQEYSKLRREGEKKNKQQQQGGGLLYSTLNQDDDTPPPVPPAYNPERVQEYSVLKREGENKGQQSLSTGATGLYSTIKDTNNQVLVDESAHKPVYADLAIAAKGKRPQAAPRQEQPVVYALVNNKSVPPPIAPPPAPDKYAAVNGNRKSTTQELIMNRLGGLDIPPPIPPKPKP